MLPKRSISPAACVFLLAFAIRLLVLTRLADSPFFIAASGDTRFYSDWALRIASGIFTDHKAFYGLPGYPWFLAGVFALFGFNPFLVGLLQAASEAGIAVLIFAMARSIVPGAQGRVAGGLAACGWIFFQPAQAFSAVLMPTSWLVLAFWGIVWWAMQTRSRSLWQPWLWIGTLAGIVAMMVATIFLVLPLPIFAAARNLRRAGPVMAAVAIMLAGVFLGASPCWLHNYFIAHEPVFLSAHSGVNFWIGNNPDANGYPKMPPGLRASQEGMLMDSIRLAETAAGHPLTRTEVSRFWSAKADSFIHEHTREWLALMLVKVRNVWNAFQYDDLSLITTLCEEGVLTPGIRFGIVAALAIPGLAFALGRYPRSRWVAAAVLLHMAALLPVFITERYRLAAVPGLLVLASIGLVELWAALAHREPGWVRGVCAYCVLAIASVWFVSAPQRDEVLWSLDCYNSGIKALDAGELDRAREKLERAFAYVPDNGEINLALGNLWLKKHDRAQARQFFVRAIRVNPTTLGALNNLAVLNVQDKNWEAARALLLHVLRIEPDNAKTHYILAYAEYGSGNQNAAKSEIARALALRPQQPQFQELQKDILAGLPLHPLSIQP